MAWKGLMGARHDPTASCYIRGERGGGVQAPVVELRDLNPEKSLVLNQWGRLFGC